MRDTTESIMSDWLRLHAFDGLYNPTYECACRCTDLAPCENMQKNCKPGYEVPCSPDDCGEHDWHMVDHKPGEWERI